MKAALEAAQSKREYATMQLTGDRREEVARILEIIARDGLPGPRDLDVALNAIEAAIKSSDADDDGDDGAEFTWIGRDLIALDGWSRDDERTQLRLMMASASVHQTIIETWSDDECREAEIWAMSASYAASDNDVNVPPKPEHVKRDETQD